MAELTKIERDVTSIHNIVMQIASHLGIEITSPTTIQAQNEEYAQVYWAHVNAGKTPPSKEEYFGRGAAPVATPAPEPEPMVLDNDGGEDDDLIFGEAQELAPANEGVAMPEVKADAGKVSANGNGKRSPGRPRSTYSPRGGRK